MISQVNEETEEEDILCETPTNNSDANVEANTVIHNNRDLEAEDCNTDEDLTALEDQIQSSACSTPTFRVSSNHEHPASKKVL